METNPKRISAQEARQAIDAGALFVCAYEGAKYEANKLPGSIPANALAERAPQLDQDRAIVFYCS